MRFVKINISTILDASFFSARLIIVLYLLKHDFLFHNTH